jgi:hypothetical protein
MKACNKRLLVRYRADCAILNETFTLCYRKEYCIRCSKTMISLLRRLNSLRDSDNMASLLRKEVLTLSQFNRHSKHKVIFVFHTYAWNFSSCQIFES